MVKSNQKLQKTAKRAENSVKSHFKTLNGELRIDSRVSFHPKVMKNSSEPTLDVRSS
jgi:hypothetical protein